VTPRKSQTPQNANMRMHCHYTTDECVALEDKIEELIQEMMLVVHKVNRSGRFNGKRDGHMVQDRDERYREAPTQ